MVIFFRKQLNTTINAKEKTKDNDKLLRKHNNEICNRTILKLIKMCLLGFFLVAIGDALTVQSTILLEVVGIADVIVCIGIIVSIFRKMLRANKEGKLIGEDL
jgi:hypothetical protein